jgi:hypothetical protein
MARPTLIRAGVSIWMKWHFPGGFFVVGSPSADQRIRHGRFHPIPLLHRNAPSFNGIIQQCQWEKASFFDAPHFWA